MWRPFIIWLIGSIKGRDIFNKWDFDSRDDVNCDSIEKALNLPKAQDYDLVSIVGGLAAADRSSQFLPDKPYY